MSRLGGQAVYDTDRNITWLADANYAKTSGNDTDGLMNWTAANAWAAGLNIGGYTGWRLPTTLQPDATCQNQSGGGSFGFNCTGSELGHLYYTEGGLSQNKNITSSAVLSGLFSNMQNNVYWSATVYPPIPNFALYFSTGVGEQFYTIKGVIGYAWAVRDGDVGGTSTVPEPDMIWLFGAGALAWSGARTRRRG